MDKKEWSCFMIYIGLLRGINVGGNHLVAMTDLRMQFTEMGCSNIRTIGVSGNVIYESQVELDDQVIAKRLETVFGFPIPYRSVAAGSYREILDRAPGWWGADTAWRHNILFATDDYDLERALAEIAAEDEIYEWIERVGDAIFWSSAFEERSAYKKSRYARFAKMEFYRHCTVRNRNTALKILAEITRI